MKKTSPDVLFSARRRNNIIARARKIGKQDAGFIAEIAADTILARLKAVNREFNQALDLFSEFDHMQQQLVRASNVEKVSGFGGLRLTSPGVSSHYDDAINWEEKDALPFYKNSQNLVTSVFGLHRMNDLPGILIQIRNMLAPDGLFLAALPGDQTLRELRECLITAETELTGGVSLRVEPFGEIRQYGNLLQRTGFTLPVVDSEQYTIRYSSLQSLIRDLRAMGATSSLDKRGSFVSKELFKRCEEIYRERYSDPDQKIRTTVEIVFLSGWSPHASQQKPLKPGSAQASLSDFL